MLSLFIWVRVVAFNFVLWGRGSVRTDFCKCFLLVVALPCNLQYCSPPTVQICRNRIHARSLRVRCVADTMIASMLCAMLVAMVVLMVVAMVIPIIVCIPRPPCAQLMFFFKWISPAPGQHKALPIHTQIGPRWLHDIPLDGLAMAPMWPKIAPLTAKIWQQRALQLPSSPPRSATYGSYAALAWVVFTIGRMV